MTSPKKLKLYLIKKPAAFSSLSVSDKDKTTNKKNNIEGILRNLARDEENLLRTELAFKQELEEGVILAGREVLHYDNEKILTKEAKEEKRETQERRRRDIEKIKSRLEEFGGG